jgi:hypothetical protein
LSSCFHSRKGRSISFDIAPQGLQVIENFFRRMALLVRCMSINGDSDVFVGEPVRHVAEASASGVSDLDAFRCLGNELRLLIIDDNVMHDSVSWSRLPRCYAF